MHSIIKYVKKKGIVLGAVLSLNANSYIKQLVFLPACHFMFGINYFLPNSYLLDFECCTQYNKSM